MQRIYRNIGMRKIKLSSRHIIGIILLVIGLILSINDLMRDRSPEAVKDIEDVNPGFQYPYFNPEKNEVSRVPNNKTFVFGIFISTIGFLILITSYLRSTAMVED